MPRKKPSELKSQQVEPTISEPVAEPVAAPAPAQPEISYDRPMTIDRSAISSADMNGDGHISKQEMQMHLEFKRKELEDADAMRDAQRSMAWFSLAGMLLYPAIVLIAVLTGLDSAAKILGDMAGVYFIAVAGIVAAFFGAQAISNKKK